MPVIARSSDAIAPAHIKARRRISIALALIAFAVSPLLLLHGINKTLPGTHTDLMPRWIGSRAALEGENPYSAEVLRQIQTAYYGHPVSGSENLDPQLFLYPAPIILFIAPLTRLSWQATGLVFLLIICPMLIWSFWLCIRSLGLHLSTSRTAVILLLAFFSLPVMWGLRLQQPTLAVAILIFAAMFLLTRDHELVPGMLLAMATIKPQLVLPLLVWLCLWAVVQRRWVLPASFTGALTLIWYATDRIVPHWFSLWRASLRDYSGATRSAFPLEAPFGHWVGLAITVALTAACGITFWRMRRCAPGSPEFGVAVSLALAGALNLVTSHVLMIYNDVLLLPAFLLLFFAKPAGRWPAFLRIFALAILGLEFAVMIVCGFGAASGHAVSVWTAIPFFRFPDDLLPSLLMVFLMFNGWQMLSGGRVHAQTRPNAHPDSGQMPLHGRAETS